MTSATGSSLDDSFAADWLMLQEFPDIRYVVENMIPEGLTLLVAAPKIGKSWLALGLALAVASGGLAFGTIPTGQPRPVLYLALEDGKRRLQGRLRSLEATSPPGTLTFITQLPHAKLIETIRAFVQLHRDEEPVVILDTLGKVMPSANAGESAYERDYRIGGALKEVVDSATGASLIVVHHSRKAQADDFLDSVSGTQGLAGSADTIVVLKRNRHDSRATLSVTSRDAAEGEFALQFEETGEWTLEGGSPEEAARAAETARATSGVSDRMAEVIGLVGASGGGITPKELSSQMNISNDDAGRYLRRAADSGRIARVGRGLYAAVRSDRMSEAREGFGQSDTSDIDEEAE